MNKLNYLIKYLLDENKNIRIDEMPTDEISLKRLYRSLCNIREPKPISAEYIQIENEYLQEELKKKNITKVESIKTVEEMLPNSNLEHKSQMCLWRGNITTLEIDAIVNAANSKGLGCFIALHNCIDNQVNSNSGISLRLECNEIMKQKNYNLGTGEAIITNGYNLPAKYIIHTVGPIIYDEVTEVEVKQLENCYINCLKLAVENGIRNIAFPCISTGVFRFPKYVASKIAINTVNNFLKQNSEKFDKIVFNVFDENDYEIYLKNLGEDYGRI